jgi:uncharacterized membrane protein YedE/YeeE
MNPTEFTPLAGLAGGLLIGLAAAVLLLSNGRIAGVSGILGRSLLPEPGDLGWRVAFLAGLPLGAWGVGVIAPSTTALVITHSAPLLVAAGLLVGVGTQVGSGCTSGHGVCGIGRGSPRSIAATAIFMATAIAVTSVVRHVLGAA